MAIILSGLNIGFPLSRKPDYGEEKDCYRSNHHLLSAFLFGTIPHSLHVLFYSIFTTGNVRYHPHVLDEETEAGRGEVTCQK